MSITFNCDNCGTTYKVADQYAGKKTTCRKCSQTLLIPEPAADSLDAPTATARPLESPMFRRDADDSLSPRGAPALAPLPKVERPDDVQPFDYRPATSYGATGNSGLSVQSRKAQITKLFVVLVLLAVIGGTIYVYVL